MEIPPMQIRLHRSDGGLGGFGRASEGQWDSDPRRCVGRDNTTAGEGEESLAMAKKFLSRLVSCTSVVSLFAHHSCCNT